MNAASVIICAHDRPDWLSETLDKLARQTVQPQVLVIDDSVHPRPPDSRGLLNLHYEHRLAHGRYHRVAKYNRGMQIARSQALILLDDDCVPRCDDFVASYLADLATAPVVRGAFWHDERADYTPWLSTANIGFQRDFMLNVLGGFDPAYDGYYGYEDLDLERLLEKLGVTPRWGRYGTVVEHRGQPYSGLRDQTNERYYRKKWGFAPI